MRFIMPVLLGAVIGYTTNWLAIKMLFRPRYEKRMFGLRMPFTPGLIPKEINRIAKSVGETVGKHLLSPEVVIETISNKDTGYRIKAWIGKGISELKRKDVAIGDLLSRSIGENYGETLDKVVQGLTRYVVSLLKKQRFKDGIVKVIKNRVFDKYEEDIFIEVKEKIQKFIYNISASEEIGPILKNIIENKFDKLKLDTRTLNDVVPDNIIRLIDTYLNEHTQDIMNMFKGMFENPIIERKFKESITEIIFENTHKFTTMLIKPEFIAEKMYTSIKKYTSDPKNSNNIILIIKVLINRLLQNKVSGTVTGITSEAKERYINSIVENLLVYISNRENQDKAFTLIEENVKIPKEDVKGYLLDLISDKLNSILSSPEINKNVNKFFSDSIKEFLNKPASSVFEHANEEIITNFIDFAKDVFSNLIKNKLPDIIKLFDISKVVEDRINGFDVDFAEEIIIEIAKRELSAITWLGALLGGIMGIILPLIQF